MYIYKGVENDGLEIKATYGFLGAILYLRLVSSNCYLNATVRRKIVNLVVNKCLYPDIIIGE